MKKSTTLRKFSKRERENIASGLNVIDADDNTKKKGPTGMYLLQHFVDIAAEGFDTAALAAITGALLAALSTLASFLRRIVNHCYALCRIAMCLF